MAEEAPETQQPSITPESDLDSAPATVVTTTPRQTDALLEELLVLIRQANEPPVSPESKLLVLTKAVKDYWVWVPILGFLIAWSVYQFNPFYFLAQYKIASDESSAKIASIDYKKNTHEYYINLGNSLLNSGKSKDAALAYQQAKKIEPFSLQAEYGIRKTGLLAFSEEKQFDPVIAHARFAELNKLAPAGVDATKDPHIRYAQALFLWQTDNSAENTEAVKSLLQAMDPEAKKHSAALALLGEIALQQDDLDLAIASFNKALQISPHHWSAINNLAYAYQQRAEQYFAQGDLQKGLASMKKEVYPRYQKAARLDAEIITPNIELKRLKALLELPSGQVNLQVENLIAQIETDKLQLMVKNKDELFYQWLDKQGKKQEAAISSWEAKKAYLLQLQWLVHYFQPGRGVVNKQTVKAELAKIQNTSIDGKMNLPSFLYNDLSSLKSYHPKWIGQTDIAQKYTLLLTIVQR